MSRSLNDLPWIVEDLLNGVVEGSFLRHLVPVKVNGVTVVLRLLSVDELIGKDRHRNERHTVVNCFLVAEQSAVSDEETGLWVTEQILLRQPRHKFDVGR